jgi:acyl carrier protein
VGGCKAVPSIENLKRFLRKNNKVSSDISDTDDLIETGILDSLRFLDFIHVIEEESGKTIDVDNLNIDDFRTMARIIEVYFPQRRPPAY